MSKFINKCPNCSAKMHMIFKKAKIWAFCKECQSNFYVEKPHTCKCKICNRVMK